MTGRNIFYPCCLQARQFICKTLKSSAWDKHGVISSIRPDKLSYIVLCDGRYFTRPRRLLRPVPSATPIDTSSASTVIPPPVLLRRSLRLQARSRTAHVQFSPSSTSATHCPRSSSTASVQLSSSSSSIAQRPPLSSPSCPSSSITS